VAKKTVPASTAPSHASIPAQVPSAKPKAELPYPIIEFAANNSVLYPMDVLEGTRATLTLPAGATHVLFYMAIEGQEEPTFEPVSVEDGVDVVEIPAQLISYCIGHTVLMRYTATVGGQLRESLTLELQVQHILEDDLLDSRPVFKNSTNEWNTWWLRMHNFSGDEIVEIKAWPMIYPGQRLFVTVAGNQHIAPYRFIWVALGHVVQPGEAHADHIFRFRLSRGWLSRLGDYSAITAHLGVIWDTTVPVFPEPGDPMHENPLPVNAQDFHLRTTSLLEVDPTQELSAPHLRESVELPPGHWQVNPANTVNGGHAIVAYDGMAQDDHVCAYASGPNGVRVPLGCQDVVAGQASLSFDVAPDLFAALFNQTLTLDYSLQFNHYAPQRSPERVVKVLGPQLTTPDIEEVTSGVLDLNTFHGDATALVPIWDYAKEGACCWMWITGVLEDGSAHGFDVLVSEPLTTAWLADGVATAIARDKLRELADCSVMVLHFAASFDGLCERETALEFPSRRFHLVQENVELTAPAVLEAVGSQLTIWNGRFGVTVRVAYERINPNDTITGYWVKPNGARLPLGPEPGNSESGYVDFSIPREAVIRGAGQTIQVSYTVASACKVRESKVLKLTISQPVRLPTPVVPQATPPATQGGLLDLASFAGDASITVEKWWFALVGQRVWLKCTGVKKDDSAYTFYVSNGSILTQDDVNEGLVRKLDRAHLELLKHDSPLVVTCTATTDESQHERDGIVFPVLNLVVRRILICEIERFEDLARGTYSAGGRIQTPLMTITFESGAGLAGIVRYGNNQFYSGNHFVMCQNVGYQVPPQLHRIEFSRALESVRFSWSWKQRPAHVTFYDEDGQVITSANYPDDWQGGFWVEHTTTPGTAIKSMLIHVEDYSFIDNFSMCYRT